MFWDAPDMDVERPHPCGLASVSQTLDTKVRQLGSSLRNGIKPRAASSFCVATVGMGGEGFLGTGAPFTADLNLVVQVMMAIGLGMVALFARRKLCRLHAITQTTVLVLNLGMIAWVMLPSTWNQVMPAFPDVLAKPYFAAPAIHAGFGVAAEMLGIYIALVAGTSVVSEKWRFRKWKLWMRIELVLWWIALTTGMLTYYVWYVVPFRA